MARASIVMMKMLLLMLMLSVLVAELYSYNSSRRRFDNAYRSTASSYGVYRSWLPIGSSQKTAMIGIHAHSHSPRKLRGADMLLIESTWKKRG
jgi:hypothetical protein